MTSVPVTANGDTDGLSGEYLSLDVLSLVSNQTVGVIVMARCKFGVRGGWAPGGSQKRPPTSAAVSFPSSLETSTADLAFATSFNPLTGFTGQARLLSPVYRSRP